MTDFRAEFDELINDRKARAIWLSIAAKALGYRAYEAEDMVQKSLCEVYPQLADIKTSLKWFIITIIRRNCWKFIREMTAKPEVHFNDGLGSFGAAVIAQFARLNDTPESIVLENEKANRLARALLQLSPAQRSHYEDYVQRGYKSQTHGQQCATSVMKRVLKSKVATA